MEKIEIRECKAWVWTLRQETWIVGQLCFVFFIPFILMSNFITFLLEWIKQRNRLRDCCCYITMAEVQKGLFDVSVYTESTSTEYTLWTELNWTDCTHRFCEPKFPRKFKLILNITRRLHSETLIRQKVNSVSESARRRDGIDKWSPPETSLK